MKYVCTNLYVLVLLFFNINAQTDNLSNLEKDIEELATVKWAQIESKDKNFSIAFPENFSITVDEKFSIRLLSTSNFHNLSEIGKNSFEFKDMRSVTAFQNGTSMWMKSYAVKDGNKAFPTFLNYENRNSKQTKDYEYKNFAMREVFLDKADFHKIYYFYSKNKVYLVGVASNDKNNPILSTFLQSIKVYGEPLFKVNYKTSHSVNQNLILDSLGSSALEITYLINKGLNLKDQLNDEPKDKDITPMVLLDIPKPGNTAEALQNRVNGFVLLEVTFGSNGLVQKIEVLKELKYGLTERAISATRQIKFLPEQKNGIPIDKIRRIRFNFKVD